MSCIQIYRIYHFTYSHKEDKFLRFVELENIEKVKEIYDVKCVCDNRSELWGSVTETGLRVISPEQLKEMKDVAVLVMVDNKDVYFSIALQVIDLGIKRVWFVGERLKNRI